MFKKILLIVIEVGVVLAILVFAFSNLKKKNSNQANPALSSGNIRNNSQEVKVKRFKSEKEIKEYLENNENYDRYASLDRRGIMEAEVAGWADGITNGSFENVGLPTASGLTPTRNSQTNVQVLSIDEPDIVKTGKDKIYFSNTSQQPDILSSNPEGDFSPPVRMPDPREEPGSTEIIQAFPPQDLKVQKSINESGELLLKENNLVIISEKYHEIYSYDVSNPNNPDLKWELKLKENSLLLESRLYQDKIYLISRTDLNSKKICPIEPIEKEGQIVSIPCDEIYYSEDSLTPDSTYNVVVLDIKNGQVLNSLAFLGSRNNTNIYMSEGSIYLSFLLPSDQIALVTGFFQQNSDFFSPELVEKIEKLQKYDLGQEAKMVEMERLLERYYLEQRSGEELDSRLEEELEKRLAKYMREKIRTFQQTGVVKIDNQSLKISAAGSFPGSLLNQFSLDEYQGDLRVATNINPDRMGGLGFSGSGVEEANDVYILNDKLEIIGSIVNLGLKESIYSVRFLGERGYLVTFEQIDPFFVMDLAEPTAPKVKGELKIPGYSSYLHPLDADLILGVGEEEGKVKLSLFKVSDPANPQEISKAYLDEYYSEVTDNHHAFLLDKKYKNFFLPAGGKGFIFSYEGGELVQKQDIVGLIAKRAVYIDNFMYIIGEDRIKVVDQNNMEIVNNLPLQQ